jgi:primosomal protein N' (replication factor Y)
LFPEQDLPAPTVEGPFASIALNRPVDFEFTYRVPAELEARIAVGMRVAVPFGSGREVGIVTALSEDTEVAPGKLRPLARLLDGESLVGDEMLDLARWIGRRYACSFGEALHAILPAALKREGKRARIRVAHAVGGVGERELAEIEDKQPKQHRLLRTLIEVGGPIELRECLRRLNISDAPARSLERRGWIAIEYVPAGADELFFAKSDRPRPERLNPDQRRAVETICLALDSARHTTYLLEGVTGSGKTEVYLAAIEHALTLGRGAIVLVPEIALTPQTVGWFRARFDSVAVLHSRMTDVQRLEMWSSVKSGAARVVVGARSAVFAPVADLGVIVVDEEHEPSFKQASTPRYHARDVAMERARAAGCICLLGSATPSLETWNRAHQGEISRLGLPSRIGGRPMPPVEIVDMRLEKGGRGSSLFSARLEHLLGETLGRKEQVILFLNRRGFAPILWCPGCKLTVRCEQCDVALTYHKRIDRLVCHACCDERARPAACPTCTAPFLRYLGAGSERIERELERLAPRARVRRMDSDTMRRREDYEETLSAFGRGEIDCLVGTQMIAKGLDFPRVTLVGIVNADSALHLPDFRASERTFQLVAQVSGRAGRADLPGRIVVQTLFPEHAAIARAAAHDYEGFAKAELELRRELGYPPAARLVRMLFEDTDLERATQACLDCAEALRRSPLAADVTILGPAPAPISLLRGRHRQHLLIKSSRDLEPCVRLLVDLAKTSRPRPTIDVDPVSML